MNSLATIESSKESLQDSRNPLTIIIFQVLIMSLSRVLNYFKTRMLILAKPNFFIAVILGLSFNAVADDLEVKDSPELSAKKNREMPYIEEVIVTATKRDMSLREIPQSITAMGGEDLEKLGIQSSEEIARLVPGVNMTTPSQGATIITVRGIAAQPGTNVTTGLLFGDTSLTDAYLQTVSLDPNPFDLKSVEVLKGPQGTLFGAGALNGAIRYVPEPAALDELQFKYFTQYTSVENGGAEPIYGAAVNIPFGSSVALRLVAVDRTSPGWVDNIQMDKEDANFVNQSSYRAMLNWQPSEKINTKLTYVKQNTDFIENAITDNISGELKSANKPRFSPAENEYDLTDLQISYDFDFATLVWDTAYLTKEMMNFTDASSRLPEILGVPTTGQDIRADSETLTHELRLISRDDVNPDWRWITGVVWWEQDISFFTGLPVEAAGVPLYPFLGPILATGLQGLLGPDGNPSLAAINSDIQINELALFADVTRIIGDWEISVGGRYYQTESGGSSEQSGVVLLIANGAPISTIEAEVNESGFNPKVSVLWHASENILTYIAATRGFRVGGIQPGYAAPGEAAPPVKFKSDTLWNYEFGLRTEWYDGVLRADVTAFFVDWKDPQVFQLSDSGIGSYIDNVGGVESEGIELALQYRVPFIPGLSLTSAVSSSKTVTTEPFSSPEGENVSSGAKWPFAPEFQSATTLLWSFNAGNWILNSGVTHTYIGEAKSSLAVGAKDIFDFEQWDLQLGISNPELSWLPELSVVLNNAKDERGVTHYWESGVVDTKDVTYIRPRAITFRLSGQF